MKDNFSTNSDKYLKYRPFYPSDFFDYLNSLIQHKENAWDCGTGNGQIAFQLTKTFNKVYATDISQSQIDNALKKENIKYSVQPAENSSFENAFFDLIIVGQAIHWFDFPKFYKEVKRTARKDGIFCAIGYGKVTINKQVDNIVSNFYTRVIGKYWDEERKYIDAHYNTIPFPFQEITTPYFVNKYHWQLDYFLGYLNTWSAVKHFIQQNNYNPIDYLKIELAKHWNDEQILEVNFPTLLRIGKVSF